MTRWLPLLLLPLGLAHAQEAPERVTMRLGEFLQLYEASVDRAKAPPGPSRAASLAQATYVGTVTETDAESSHVVVDGVFRVEVHQDKGFVKIPVLASDVALISATIQGRPAPLVLEGNAYNLVTNQKGSFEVYTRFAVDVVSNQGASSFGFTLLPAGGTTLSLSIPGTDPLEVNVAGARLLSNEVRGDHTVVEAALSSSQRLAASWQRQTRSSEPGVAETPRVDAEVRTLVGVGDGLVRATASVQHTILFAGVRSFRYDVPDGATVLDVRGSGLREWTVDTNGDLLVQLNYAAEASYALAVDMEQVAKDDTLLTPILRPLGVERTKGWVGIVADGGLEVTAKEVKGAVPVDVRTLPGAILGLTSQPVLLGFKYLGDDASVPLAITEHEAVDVLVTLLDRAIATTMVTEHGRRLTSMVYDVRNNRRQFLSVQLPQGATLWSASVAGRAVQPSLASDGAVLLPLLRSASSGAGLSSFPVEVVYVEEGTATGRRAHTQVSLPRVDVPMNYVGWRIHVPVGSKLLPRSATGDMYVVDGLARAPRAPSVMVVEQAVDGARSAGAAQEASGGLGGGSVPVRVEVPVEGPAIRFERLLVLDEPISVGFDWIAAR